MLICHLGVLTEIQHGTEIHVPRCPQAAHLAYAAGRLAYAVVNNKETLSPNKEKGESQ